MNDSNVIELLLENGADVNYVNSFGNTLLHTHINNVEVVNLLFELIIDIIKSLLHLSI
jgi:ankyrin repeat protein